MLEKHWTLKNKMVGLLATAEGSMTQSGGSKVYSSLASKLVLVVATMNTWALAALSK